VTDGAARFAARYPVVWHVIECDGAGPWLETLGLLPTRDLYHLAGTPEDGRNRDDFRRLDLGQGRVAVLRPQLMADHLLAASLAGSFTGRPDRWRQLINAHVFFWPEARRRDSFVDACRRLRVDSRVTPTQAAPRAIAFDTAALLTQCGADAFYARINTGAALRGGARARRDDTAFASLADYRSGRAAELAIRGPVMLRGLQISC
jgi:hypothetical protein